MDDDILVVSTTDGKISQTREHVKKFVGKLEYKASLLSEICLFLNIVFISNQVYYY